MAIWNTEESLREEFLNNRLRFPNIFGNEEKKLAEQILQEGFVHQWVYKGLPCRIQRNPHFGNWCGYVGVPFGHPAHERGYSEEVLERYVDVHGGLTFAEFEHAWAKDNIWWLGFDCAHWDDLTLGSGSGMRKFCTYKDKEYVIKETERLADQLVEMEKKKSVPE